MMGTPLLSLPLPSPPAPRKVFHTIKTHLDCQENFAVGPGGGKMGDEQVLKRVGQTMGVIQEEDVDTHCLTMKGA